MRIDATRASQLKTVAMPADRLAWGEVCQHAVTRNTNLTTGIGRTRKHRACMHDVGAGNLGETREGKRANCHFVLAQEPVVKRREVAKVETRKIPRSRCCSLLT